MSIWEVSLICCWLMWICWMQSSCSLFEFLSWFLVELSLLDYDCLRFLPSTVAASAIFIAKFTLQPEKHPWVRNTSIYNNFWLTISCLNAISCDFQGLKMQRYSGYMPCDLKACVLAIHDLQLSRRASSSRAIREKYSHHKVIDSRICYTCVLHKLTNTYDVMFDHAFYFCENSSGVLQYCLLLQQFQFPTLKMLMIKAIKATITDVGSSLVAA